jgi:ubiquinone/menaquinone biosynthesis C-methylase UbiE
MLDLSILGECLLSRLIAFNHISQAQIRVIDVACGTGLKLKLVKREARQSLNKSPS